MTLLSFAGLLLSQLLSQSENTVYLVSPVLQNALEDVSWRLADGLLQCSFRRRIHLPAYKGRFNLDASYYIFLADGEASEGKLDLHMVAFLLTAPNELVTLL